MSFLKTRLYSDITQVSATTHWLSKQCQPAEVHVHMLSTNWLGITLQIWHNRKLTTKKLTDILRLRKQTLASRTGRLPADLLHSLFP